MNPAQKAQQIVDNAGLPATVDRDELVAAIRWAILQGQIEAKRPPEIELERAPAIVQQIVWFVDEHLRRMRGSSYAEQAEALRQCRVRVLALYNIVPAEGHAKPPGKALKVRA